MSILSEPVDIWYEDEDLELLLEASKHIIQSVKLGESEQRVIDEYKELMYTGCFESMF